jgi:hypothetical protein
LFGRGATAALRIVPRRQMEPLDWREPIDPVINSRGPHGRTWHRFAWLSDGSWLAINLDINIRSALRDRTALRERARSDTFAPICHVTPATVGRPGENPVIALSFTELLDKLLEARGRTFWLDPGFEGYGDAEEFTRRR